MAQDILGYRARIGILVPPTNAVVESDLHRLAPAGVTIQTARLDDAAMENADQMPVGSDRVALALESLGRSVGPALRTLMRAEVHLVALAFVIESAYFGRARDLAWRDELRAQAGIEALTAADAIIRGLAQLGAHRISVVTPYTKTMNDALVGYFEQCGVSVQAISGLVCESPTHCKLISERTVREALAEVDRPESQLVLACGTGLSAVKAADDVERSLGKPVLACNAIVLWASLRALGIADRQPNAGILLREH